MSKIIGFALFCVAVGMLIAYLVEGFIEFLVITILLLLSYIFFCRR